MLLETVKTREGGKKKVSHPIGAHRDLHVLTGDDVVPDVLDVVGGQLQEPEVGVRYEIMNKSGSVANGQLGHG